VASLPYTAVGLDAVISLIITPVGFQLEHSVGFLFVRRNCCFRCDQTTDHSKGESAATGISSAWTRF